MENPMMGGANPDGVEAEVGNYWRTLYKLEKNFDSIPTAKRIAGKVDFVFKLIHIFMSFFQCK